MNPTQRCVKLSSNYSMPLVGIGTYKIVGRETIHNVLDEALKVGYRSIDTAAVYRNEEDIGIALKALLPKYNLTREDIFITTKLAPSDHGDSKKIRNAVENALTSLGVSYIDLYLIHWPGKSGIPENSDVNGELRSKTWKTLVELKSQGILRSIGVSNYNIKHLKQLLENCNGTRPAVNQVECHPHYRQTELLRFCEKEEIHVQAYSSLGTSSYKSLLKDPTVCRVAEQLNVSSARVLLKWALQQNIDSVAKLCMDKYNSMKKTGKPTNNEWTVLAGIIMRNNDDILSIVSLATGTKCLSGIEITNEKLYNIGDRLSDSHAEILARRGFLRYLYEQIDLLFTTKKSEIFITVTNETIEIKPGITFHFYCSQTPCGDCSIIPMINDETFDADVTTKKRKIMAINDSVERDSIVIIEDSTLIQDIHRTGAKCLTTEKNRDLHLSGMDYHVTGPLRTKPGRGDPTLSLSCSDKIAKWNAIGIQGSLLSLFVPVLRLKTIIIGGECPFSREAMERGIYKRFGNDLTGPNILQATVNFTHKRNSVRYHPCPTSIVWCAVRNRSTEIIVGGCKQGATKNLKNKGLLVNRKNLLRSFFDTVDKHPSMKNIPLHPKKINYYHCKQWCDSYQREWKNLKTTKFSTWPEKPAILQSFAL